VELSRFAARAEDQIGLSTRKPGAISIYRLIEITGLKVSPAGSCMKILVYSDLHTEFEDFTPPATGADVVILAGDIGVKTRGVQWANAAFGCPVIYVCGNHEFYDGHLERTLEEMKAVAASHVHVLENECWIWNQTRFLCATAWTDFSLTGSTDIAMRRAAELMNDFRVIRTGADNRRLRPEDVAVRNLASRTWLSQELSKPFAGLTAVVTHHAPLVGVLNGPRDHLDAAYANHWPDLVHQADLWVFGHTHCPVDLMERDCRVVSNPRGYPGERLQFRSDFEVEI
jgi:predicted phosphodiesterase